MFSQGLSRLAIAVVSAGAALAPSVATASDDADSCDVVDVEYATAAKLKVTDTLMGAGDGEYRIGPGHIVLRFDHGGSSGVRMLAYEMPQHFTVVSNVLFWKTTVATRAESRALPPHAIIAEGKMDGHTLHWRAPGVGFRSDGTITCNGSMCGQFGAPPPGTTELHVGPNPLDFRPFEFDATMKTFSMPFAFVSESSAPKQRSFLALGAREIRRTCATVGAPVGSI
jgi:hypothetical protein